MTNPVKFCLRLAKVLFMGARAGFVALRLRGQSWRGLLEPQLAYELYITHGLGGGTKNFTDNYVKAAQGILVLQNITYGKDFLFVLENPKTRKACRVRLEDVAQILQSAPISKITVNSLVTNLHLFGFLSLLEGACQPIVVMVHDFYPVCPNYTLFVEGQYCGFRFCREGICPKCLKDLNPFIVPKRLAVVSWRERWLPLLQKAIEIRCFSRSSKEIVQRAYPAIPDARITVVPHDMSYCSFAPVTYTRERLHVGIIGEISGDAKGRAVVRRFLRYAKQEGLDVTVIGRLTPLLKIRGKTIKYTGRYKRDDLPRLIQKRCVNAILFPSVWPETFSYVVSEAMQMSLPVVCFDCGAQAEKVRAYPKGVVCASDEPANVYAALRQALAL